MGYQPKAPQKLLRIYRDQHIGNTVVAWACGCAITIALMAAAMNLGWFVVHIIWLPYVAISLVALAGGLVHVQMIKSACSEYSWKMQCLSRTNDQYEYANKYARQRKLIKY